MNTVQARVQAHLDLSKSWERRMLPLMSFVDDLFCDVDRFAEQLRVASDGPQDTDRLANHAEHPDSVKMAIRKIGDGLAMRPGDSVWTLSHRWVG